MGLGSIGVPGLILILIVALLLFGPNKLPELGRAFGKTIKEFKKGTKDLLDDEEDQKSSASKSEGKSELESKQETKKESRRLPE
ncbi:twin-arginine translocase TatA/TatE family subunit [Marinicrinis sediminis]|uniref:Sec-independent protein translocase protein TatA n=1 Tax=Marinicrinis sediminis TaxID=1652465 RepID=A0ABW5R7S4_9BACL